MPRRFTTYRQHDAMDCGPACLRMVARHYGRSYSLETLRSKCGINREGVSLLGISEAAEALGFRTVGARLTWDQLKKQAPMPCIVYWNEVHYIVVYRIRGNRVWIADPAKGKLTLRKKDFLRSWLFAGKDGQVTTGVTLLFYSTPRLYEMEGEARSRLNFSILLRYVLPYKNLIFQLALGLLAGSLLQLIFPFLTQAVVDIGINTRDVNFIVLILVAQVMLFLGRTGVEFIRSWILLHMSARINISILSDFLIKLMKLPMPFFDTRMVGDIMQRMGDHSRIQSFLTGQTLSTLFSFANLIVFSIVLAWYHMMIFTVFLVCSVAYVGWVFLFLRKRKELDHRRFHISSDNQSTVIQLIQGMQEIKLAGCEKAKRWEWERLQAGLFRFQVSSLVLNQYQQGGAFFINEGKNIAITFLSAVAVVHGQLTLGAMMAIQYIIGQLNGPVQQLIGFVQATQDAHISLERLNEIHQQEDEEPEDRTFITRLPQQKDLHIRELRFTYPGAGNEPVLRDIDLTIEEGKTTALVGESGSGKTTLVKLLLKFYSPDKGRIRLGEVPFESVSPRFWRSRCGVVMQDGFIFSGSIASNIAVGEERPDPERIEYAVRVANIGEFIESLPQGYDAKIGADGNGISQGQRQRILIARAVYKNPDYIFFDEATNALDANNEGVIMEHLQEFFSGRTVVVVAHRLSTVRGADKIVVLDGGRLIEQGTHHELLDLQGDYYRLVKNQLESGQHEKPTSHGLNLDK